MNPRDVPDPGIRPEPAPSQSPSSDPALASDAQRDDWRDLSTFLPPGCVPFF